MGEINSILTKEKKKKKYLVITKQLYYPWSGTVLFESGFGLVVNVYCKLQDNHKRKWKNTCYERRKYGIIYNAELEVQKAEKSMKDENGTKITNNNKQ